MITYAYYFWFAEIKFSYLLTELTLNYSLLTGVEALYNNKSL